MIKPKMDMNLDFEDLLFEQDDFFEEAEFGFLDRKKYRNLLIAS